MPNGRTILGLDPGSRKTGYGLLRIEAGSAGIVRIASGVLRLDEDRPFAERLPELARRDRPPDPRSPAR